MNLKTFTNISVVIFILMSIFDAVMTYIAYKKYENFTNMEIDQLLVSFINKGLSIHLYFIITLSIVAFISLFIIIISRYVGKFIIIGDLLLLIHAFLHLLGALSWVPALNPLVSKIAIAISFGRVDNLIRIYFSIPFVVYAIISSIIASYNIIKGAKS